MAGSLRTSTGEVLLPNEMQVQRTLRLIVHTLAIALFNVAKPEKFVESVVDAGLCLDDIRFEHWAEQFAFHFLGYAIINGGHGQAAVIDDCF